MKKIIYHLAIVSLLCAAPLLYSCDDMLSPEILADMTEDDIITRYGNTEQTLNGLYTYLPDGFAYIGDEWSYNAAMLAGASDEAEYTIETNEIQKFNTGSWNAIDNPDPAWKRNFEGVNAVNLLLVNINSVNMDNLLYNPSSAKQEDYRKNLIRMERWKYEARFLRAYFYFELVKRYGGVPIIEKPVSLDDDYSGIQRESLGKCIDFIVSECNICADSLPGEYMPGELGRATKGAALSLKSRVLLYAASELPNEPERWAPGYAHPELISLTDGKTRQERWQEAAEAAAAVMTMQTEAVTDWYPAHAPYSLYTKAEGGLTAYERIFRFPYAQDNTEVILAKRMGAKNSFERNNSPVGYNLGNSGITPSRNMVDAYYFKEGRVTSSFDWENENHVAEPFSSSTRDLRLFATILLNNDYFNSRKVQAFTGGLDGKGVMKATKTGFYLKKYMDSNLDLLRGESSGHAWILIRLAEIYLNYAEAVNEISGPQGKAGSVSMTARDAVNAIRSRGGAAVLPPVANNVNQSDLRDIIKYERRIELAFEDHRLWDLRRRLEAEDALNKDLLGLEITETSATPVMTEARDENGEIILDEQGNPVMTQAREPFGNLQFDRTFTYRPVRVEARIFRPHMYLYPVPQKEINLTGWQQNPGW
ncbi:MAG: RagB/SusD family nutrient uptake outer membrane protein [Dysgonamonadaceae bacterium]|nr:RagB/SusD family nutrient uptake outer membrane protein [Dysgonamonadaceae bacterium]